MTIVSIRLCLIAVLLSVSLLVLITTDKKGLYVSLTAMSFTYKAWYSEVSGGINVNNTVLAPRILLRLAHGNVHFSVKDSSSAQEQA